MIKGYTDFYYNVKDMKKAVNFYKAALQMTVVFGDEYWTSMKVGNLNLGLHWSEGHDIPRTKRDDHGQDSGGTLTFSSSDVKEDRLRIERNGGKILGESVQPWGHMLVFEDLDGNVLKLKG